MLADFPPLPAGEGRGEGERVATPTIFSRPSSAVIPALALVVLCVFAAWLACAQIPRTGVGKDFMYPDYWPHTTGVARKKSVIRADEYQLLTNNLAALTGARIDFYKQDGTNLEWSATAHEAEVDINSRQVRGDEKVFFRTADDRLFVTGTGFLWQQTNGLLILYSNTFTWMEIRTNTPSKSSTNKMKPLLAVTLLATARLSAAEMEIPPARPGLIIRAGLNILNLKSNEVLYSNNVLVTYPPRRTNDPITYLRCDWATGKLGTNRQPEEIAAHGRVALDSGDKHARGNYALYTATDEMLSLVGAFDPANASRPLPYVYGPEGTNEGSAIIYERRTGRIRTLDAITHINAEALKSVSSTNRSSTNVADQPKNSSPLK